MHSLAATMETSIDATAVTMGTSSGLEHGNAGALFWRLISGHLCGSIQKTTERFDNADQVMPHLDGIPPKATAASEAKQCPTFTTSPTTSMTDPVDTSGLYHRLVLLRGCCYQNTSTVHRQRERLASHYWHSACMSPGIVLVSH